MKTAEETFRDKIYRSATFEGMADKSGFPTQEFVNLYLDLAKNGVKNIVTGCAYISQEGRMVQPGQAGIESDDSIPYFQKVTDAVHKYDGKIFLQLNHAGRQTSSSVTGMTVVGASKQPSKYFMSKPKQLSIDEIYRIIGSFAEAAVRAKQAGFDGIQIHAAHGYLVHQFLHPCINNRNDEFGINKNTGIGDLFLRKIIFAIREKCGEDFPILVKISASDKLKQPFTSGNFISLIKMLDAEKVYALEISYGTMEDALNIFRGESIPVEMILGHNFRYKTDSPVVRKLWKLVVLPILQMRVLKFRENYNLQYCEIAKSQTDIPIICVGGFRRGKEIITALERGRTDYVSLCRPFICEPDFMVKLSEDSNYISQCVNCNICAIMCDSDKATRCYKR